MTRYRTGSTVAIVLTAALAAGCGGREERPQAAAEAPDAAPGTAPARAADDSGITMRVQARYFGDTEVKGRNIDVDTQNGIVTLTGHVESEATRNRAVTLARGVEGVTRVDDRLVVAPDDDRVGRAAREGERRADDAAARAKDASGDAARDVNAAWITTKIQAQYFAERGVGPWNVDVTTNEAGVVTLEGRVDTEQARARAVAVARGTDGVTRVDDRLRVVPDDAEDRGGDARADRGGSAQPIEDTWITTKLQSKYYLDGDVRGRTIDVTTQNGVVTLTGSVASEAERRQALTLARNTDGVRSVEDRLRIVADDAVSRSGETAERTARDTGAAAGGAAREAARDTREAARDGGAAMGDGWITTKIQSKYFLDGDVRGSEINVDTRGGVVTLKGSVESAAASKAAEAIARETDGVRRVVNQLVVREGAATSR
jgi:osmotically-inducible protein OsmY